MGNSTLGVGVYTFTPASVGTINRDFSGVTADGKIYCYQLLSSPGIIFVLQMTDGNTLKIEKQSAASCSASPAFTSSAMTFIR